VVVKAYSAETFSYAVEQQLTQRVARVLRGTAAMVGPVVGAIESQAER